MLRLVPDRVALAMESTGGFRLVTAADVTDGTSWESGGMPSKAERVKFAFLDGEKEPGPCMRYAASQRCRGAAYTLEGTAGLRR
jgi:hypothetical protein